MGRPSDISVAARKFLICRLRSRSMAGSSVGPAVPTAVVVGAVAVLFAIGLVVLLVVGNEIVERKAVVAGYKIHALLQLAPFVAVNFRAAHQPISHTLHHSWFTAEKISDIVS